MPKSNKMLTLPGSLTIIRRGSDAEAQIVIEFDDEKSRSRAASIAVSPADFAMALTGLAAVPGSMTFNATGTVGLRHEHCSREVFVVDGGFKSMRKHAELAVRAQETDGWRGCIDDVHNLHRRLRNEIRNGVKGVVYRVHHDRWIDDETGKPLEFPNAEEESDGD
jgi:hypothetical protein